MIRRAALILWAFLAVPVCLAFDHTHAAYDALLKQRVKGGLADYAALKRDPGKLSAYLDELAKVSDDEFKGWTEAQQLAFLFNLYNAATLKLIVDHYPVKSVKNIGGLFGSPWKQKVVRVTGQTLTLDEVEHGWLRQRYKEPRMHFALVCGAKGCPDLRAEAYVANRLDAQLDEQGRAFLATTAKNWVDSKGRKAHLSPIFKWFAADFEAKSGSVLNFVTPYFPEPALKALSQGGYSVKYTDYDWSLNDGSKS